MLNHREFPNSCSNAVEKSNQICCGVCAAVLKAHMGVTCHLYKENSISVIWGTVGYSEVDSYSKRNWASKNLSTTMIIQYVVLNRQVFTIILLKYFTCSFKYTKHYSVVNSAAW